MAEHLYKFNVSMSCGGCSGAVERVLGKLDGEHLSPTSRTCRPLTNPLILGVKSYNVDLKTQTAEVNAEESLSYKTVLEKIKKTGKKVNSGSADGEERSVE